MVAWLAKLPVFHYVNSALSANGGLNPAWNVYMVPWPLLLKKLVIMDPLYSS